MYFKEFYIDNFRGYRKFTISSNRDTNILTGVNNSGKTTILEAIALWNELFDHLIVEARRGDSRLHISQGDYRFGIKGQNYLDYRQINSVRSFGYKDIFYNLNTTSIITIAANIWLSDGVELRIGFQLKEANGSNYNVYLENHDAFNFRLFNDSFHNLPFCNGCYFSSPVATISSYEEFSTNPKIKEGIKIRESSTFFRNRIFNLSRGDVFDQFKNDLSLILYNEPSQLEFRITGEKSSDIFINIDVNLKNSGFRNISLLGSGTIQIIEILLHLFESRKELNVILLDEPDSHIHRDIQKRLLKYLSQSSIQVFLTTHNESLIRSANPNKLFFIDHTVSTDSETHFIPVGQNRLPQRKIGISNSHHSKIINQIGSETSLDILNALEADKILFVEGVDDSEYIQRLIEINNSDKECVFWSFGGLDKLISKISHYKEFFDSLGSNQTIWEKCSIIIDADFMTENQKNNLKSKLHDKLHIPIFVWSSYTIESTLLTDINPLIQIISSICISQGVTKTGSEITDTITDEVAAIKVEKLRILNDETDLGRRIAGQIEARINNLDKSLGISRTQIFDDVTLPNLFNHYRVYSNQQLNANQIAHISNKDDVEIILNNIFTKLGLNKNPVFENHFSEILSHVNPFVMNDEWNRLIQFINN